MTTPGLRQTVTRVGIVVGALAIAALPCAAKLLVAYEDDDGDVKVYDFEARRHTTLTKHPARDGAPSWSGDGRQIAFWSDRDGQADIYTMNADGANIRRRTHTLKPEGAPVLSPNGRYIAYTAGADVDDDRDRIAVLDLRTGDERLITTDAGLLDVWPSWFPDNDRILFGRRGDGVGLYEVNIDGRMDEGFIRVGWMPSVGMDGRSIAYIKRGVGPIPHDEVYIYDMDAGTDTGVPIELLGQMVLQIPRWAGPERLLVREQLGDIYLIDIATGRHQALPGTGWSGQAFDTAHPWDVSARGKKPFTWGWLKSLAGPPQ